MGNSYGFGHWGIGRGTRNSGAQRPGSGALGWGSSVGARWTADSRDRVFARAVPNLFGTFTDIEKVVPRESRWVELVAPDCLELLTDWIAELLLVFESERTLFRRAETRVSDLAGGGLGLQGHLWGEPIDPSRHSLERRVRFLSSANLTLTEGVYHASLVLETKSDTDP
jgi:SHS2 domain-containing protein